MRLSNIELEGEDIAGTLADMSEVPLNESAESPGDDLFIYVWTADTPPTRAGVILEMLGNKTVKLTGRYRFRYDPPRAASTGADQAPRGDFHLYDGSTEIAAWDAEGKARHGYNSGHRLPKKAYDAIVDRYPNTNGLKGRVLECCIEALKRGEATFVLPPHEPASPS